MSKADTTGINTTSPKQQVETTSQKRAAGRLMRSVFSTLAVLTMLLPVHAYAAVPGQVNFQGLLEDSAGLPVTASVNFDFAIFDALVNGNSLWSESQPGVTVTDGIYSVALGSITPITTTILSGGSVYLEIIVNGEPLSPRERLLAVPYALRAEEADFAGAFLFMAGEQGLFGASLRLPLRARSSL